jgi:short-subunit dehydrogenase
VLIARDTGALERIAADLSVRGAQRVEVRVADFAQTDTLPQVAMETWSILSGLDVALIAYGSLPDQAHAQADTRATQQALILNFVSPALLAGELATRFEGQRSGTLAVISSVAGDRGRQSNYIYGSAKGGLQRFLEGLRHRLFKSGVIVLDIRPGFVSTRMTSHLPQRGPLWATPDRVAADIATAIKRQQTVLYTPWFWRQIMLLVRNLPVALLHRTKL